MQENPEEWANLVEVQDKLVDQLESQLFDCRARLDFFLKEEFEVTYAKYQRGVQEDALVEYLMRRLADLYHQKYGGLTWQELLEG